MAHVVDKIVSYIMNKVDVKPDATAVILCSNFENFIDSVDNKQEIMYKDIPDFKVIGKDAEVGKFVFGTIRGKDVILAVGRLHYNYGYEIEDIANYIFILKELGCKNLIITASLGSLSKRIYVGDVVTASDHINLTGRNPLYKCKYDKYGHFFIDMIDTYDSKMIDTLVDVARHKMSIKVKQGVVIEFGGPSIETVSESRFSRQIGADLVGFNICNEVIAAKYAQLPVAVYGLVTNYATALTADKIRHEDIVHNRKLASNYYLKLLERFIRAL